jgi:hypothetical protein
MFRRFGPLGRARSKDRPNAARTFGSSYRGAVAFLQAKKKALLSKTFLNFGARGRLETNINYLISID